MNYLKGFIGSLIFFIGSACLLAFLFISVNIDPSRGIIIFIIFFSIGMARLGYGIFTGKIKLPNLKSSSIKTNKLLLKRSKKIIRTDKDSVKFLRLILVVFLIGMKEDYVITAILKKKKLKQKTIKLANLIK